MESFYSYLKENKHSSNKSPPLKSRSSPPPKINKIYDNFINKTITTTSTSTLTNYNSNSKLFNNEINDEGDNSNNNNSFDNIDNEKSSDNEFNDLENEKSTSPFSSDYNIKRNKYFKPLNFENNNFNSNNNNNDNSFSNKNNKEINNKHYKSNKDSFNLVLNPAQHHQKVYQEEEEDYIINVQSYKNSNSKNEILTEKDKIKIINLIVEDELNENKDILKQQNEELENYKNMVSEFSSPSKNNNFGSNNSSGSGNKVLEFSSKNNNISGNNNSYIFNNYYNHQPNFFKYDSNLKQSQDNNINNNYVNNNQQNHKIKKEKKNQIKIYSKATINEPKITSFYKAEDIEQRRLFLINKLKNQDIIFDNLKMEDIEIIDPTILAKISKSFCQILFDNYRGTNDDDFRNRYRFQLGTMCDECQYRDGGDERYRCIYGDCLKDQFICNTRSNFKSHLMINHFDLIKVKEIPMPVLDRTQKLCDHTGCYAAVSKHHHHIHVKKDHHISFPHEVDQCPRCRLIKNKIRRNLFQSVNLQILKLNDN